MELSKLDGLTTGEKNPEYLLQKYGVFTENKKRVLFHVNLDISNFDKCPNSETLNAYSRKNEKCHFEFLRENNNFLVK